MCAIRVEQFRIHNRSGLLKILEECARESSVLRVGCAFTWGSAKKWGGGIVSGQPLGEQAQPSKLEEAGRRQHGAVWGKEFVPYLGQDDTNPVSSLNVLCDVRKWGTFRKLNLVFAVDPQE